MDASEFPPKRRRTPHPLFDIPRRADHTLPTLQQISTLSRSGAHPYGIYQYPHRNDIYNERNNCNIPPNVTQRARYLEGRRAKLRPSIETYKYNGVVHKMFAPTPPMQPDDPFMKSVLEYQRRQRELNHEFTKQNAIEYLRLRQEQQQQQHRQRRHLR